MTTKRLAEPIDISQMCVFCQAQEYMAGARIKQRQQKRK